MLSVITNKPQQLALALSINSRANVFLQDLTPNLLTPNLPDPESPGVYSRVLLANDGTE